MEKNELQSLFTYHPDREATKKRLIAEAKALYEKGLTKEKYQPAFKSIEGSLYKFYLYPTFNCPLRCPYCYAEGGERKSNDLPAEDYLRITDEALKAGYKAIVIVGGEPLVYYEFDKYIDGLSKLERKAGRFILRTSLALPISDDRLKKICSVFDEITVSLDGDEESNDAVRGKGTFKKVVENIIRSIEFGGNISISAVMNREEAEGRPGEFLRTFCREHNIDKLAIQSPVPMGRAVETTGSYYEWRSDEQIMDQIKFKWTCGIGTNLYMQPDGKVYPCYAWCGKEQLLGDLSKEPLQEILDRGEILSYLNTGVDTNKKCSSCEVRYLCGGMCRVWSRNKEDVNSDEFDCGNIKNNILKILKRYGIIECDEDTPKDAMTSSPENKDRENK